MSFLSPNYQHQNTEGNEHRALALTSGLISSFLSFQTEEVLLRLSYSDVSTNYLFAKSTINF